MNADLILRGFDFGEYVRNQTPGGFDFGTCSINGTKIIDFGAKIIDFASKSNDFGTKIDDVGTRISDFNTKIHDFHIEIGDCNFIEIKPQGGLTSDSRGLIKPQNPNQTP